MEQSSSKRVMYDIPVTNNGARCRIILYKKQVPTSEVSIVPPPGVTCVELDGLKTPEYLAVSPQGKMPALTCSESGLKLAESDTIARFFMSEYANLEPSFQPDNPTSNYIARLHDMWMTTIQACMYRTPPPFGRFWTRKDALAEYVKQMLVIENIMVDGGTYLCGSEISYADATVFPSMVFASYCLPKFDIDPALPPKLDRWYKNLKETDPMFRKIHDEIMSGLNTWDEANAWGGYLGAGWRDDEPATIFDKILKGEIPSTVVKEDDKIFALKDINPAAPAHVLVIPKDRAALTRLRNATAEHVEILGRLLVAASEISKDESLGFGDGGARIVINDGPDGGQEVAHLHVHVLGGRKMKWPPG